MTEMREHISSHHRRCLCDLADETADLRARDCVGHAAVELRHDVTFENALNLFDRASLGLRELVVRLHLSRGEGVRSPPSRRLEGDGRVAARFDVADDAPRLLPRIRQAKPRRVAPGVDVAHPAADALSDDGRFRARHPDANPRARTREIAHLPLARLGRLERLQLCVCQSAATSAGTRLSGIRMSPLLIGGCFEPKCVHRLPEIFPLLRRCR